MTFLTLVPLTNLVMCKNYTNLRSIPKFYQSCSNSAKHWWITAHSKSLICWCICHRETQNHKKLHKTRIFLKRGGINNWICKVLIHISQWQIGGRGKSSDKLVIKEMIRCYGVLQTILSLHVIQWLLSEAAGHRCSMEKLFWKNCSVGRKSPVVEYLFTEITGTQPNRWYWDRCFLVKFSKSFKFFFVILQCDCLCFIYTCSYLTMKDRMISQWHILCNFNRCWLNIKLWKFIVNRSNLTRPGCFKLQSYVFHRFHRIIDILVQMQTGQRHLRFQLCLSSLIYVK